MISDLESCDSLEEIEGHSSSNAGSGMMMFPFDDYLRRYAITLGYFALQIILISLVFYGYTLRGDFDEVKSTKNSNSNSTISKEKAGLMRKGKLPSITSRSKSKIVAVTPVKLSDSNNKSLLKRMSSYPAQKIQQSPLIQSINKRALNSPTSAVYTLLFGLFVLLAGGSLGGPIGTSIAWEGVHDMKMALMALLLPVWNVFVAILSLLEPLLAPMFQMVGAYIISVTEMIFGA